jgi:uncharacterized protein (DUF2267 family)
MTRKRLLVVSGVAVGGVVILSNRGRRAVRQVFHDASRRARYMAGRAEGLGYRLSGAHPDLGVDDRTLADRVRSALGPLEKRLDLPRVHVMVEGHVALLHGAVGARSEADQVERMVRHVPGVQGVESYLHVGLLAGDTRPSMGRGAQQPSPQLSRLLSAGRDAGADETTDRASVRGVLAALAARLPDGERRQVFSHLPEDVRVLAEPPRRRGPAARRVRHVAEFVEATGVEGIEPGRGTAIVESVVGMLRELVPDEAAGVSAVLPAELKEFWRSAVPQ